MFSNRMFPGKAPAPKRGPVKAAPQGPTLQETSDQLNKKVDNLDLRIAKCDEDIQRYVKEQKAGSCSALSKSRALQAMKRKKMLEQQRQTMMNSSMSVETMAFQHESMKMTADTVKAMSDGVKVMESAMKEMGPIDEIDDTMAKMEDMAFEMEEINDLIGKNYALDMDDGELDAEFAALEEEIALEKMSNAHDAAMKVGGGGVSYLPDVPVGREVAAGSASAEKQVGLA